MSYGPVLRIAGIADWRAAGLAAGAAAFAAIGMGLNGLATAVLAPFLAAAVLALLSARQRMPPGRRKRGVGRIAAWRLGRNGHAWVMRSLTFSILVLIAACTQGQGAAPAAPQAPTLELRWRVSGLADPESVALSADRSFLYVSNVDGEADVKDGRGFIARVSTEGALIDREWATGLNAPKGVALDDGVLYVADIDELLALDANSGAVLRRTPLPGARFLNDVAIAADGAALVADSDAGRIYAVRDGVAEIWLEHPLLESVNGILVEESRLVVATMQGRLVAIDSASRAVTMLAEGLGDADGVASLGDGRYLVSEWPGLIHVVEPDGAHETLLDERAEGRYFNDFVLVDDVLYQPHWEPGEVSAYFLRR